MLVVDLTQPLGPETAMWPGTPAPAFRDIAQHEPDGWYARHAFVAEHSGTHLDAPAHFAEGGATVDQIPANELVKPLAVVDIREQAMSNVDYRLRCEDLRRDEELCGPIEHGSLVALLTGWGPQGQRVPSTPGNPQERSVHSPGFGRESAKWLIDQRAVCGLGIDTLSVDAGEDDALPVHTEVTAALGVWHLEGLINLEHVPPRGAMAIVGAIPFLAGSGAPARVIAICSPDLLNLERKENSMRSVYRITTFVPPENLDAVLDGVQAHTSLRFGPYEASAWWSAPGTEQFRPREGSEPTVGSAGVTERVPTLRVEFAIPRDPELLTRVIGEGLLPNHPWQEPAVFVDESMASATEIAA